MHFFALLHDRLVGNDIAQTPAGDRIGFGKGRTHNGSFPHAGQGGNICVLVRLVNNMLVNLIGDDDHIVFDGEIGDELQFIPCENSAGGIGGVAEDHAFRFRIGKCGFQLCAVKGKLRRIERNENGFNIIENALHRVVFKVGGEDHHFVACVRDRHQRSHHGLRGTHRADDVFVRIDF